MKIDESYRKYYSIPLENVQKNLQAIFDEYGITKQSQADWLEWGDFYAGLLDENGKLSERGKATMERWKGSFGDFYKEMRFAMYMID